MTRINEVLQTSSLSGKRKLNQIHNPNEVSKFIRHSDGSKWRAHASEKDEDDSEACSAPPPDKEDNGDYTPAVPLEGDDIPSEDEDVGRFFGGGVTDQERQVLDYMNDDVNDVAAPDEKIDGPWLHRRVLSFEKHINRNAELRSKFADQPARFIDSEADLDADVRALSILSEHPELYADFSRLGCAASLVGLLAHENTDIALGAIAIIGELTDEDTTASDEQWMVLVTAMLEADLIELLASNLETLNENDRPEDRDGVYSVLGVLENLSSRPETAEAVGAEDALLQWLLHRAGATEASVSQNKQYAAEVLAILVQSAADKTLARLASLDAIDTLLQLACSYRRRDPAPDHDLEEEYMSNLFEALTCLADHPAGKSRFLSAEGIELCLLLLKDAKAARLPALRLLDHACAAPKLDAVADATALCERLVQEGGLKTTFTLFVSTCSRNTGKNKPKKQQEIHAVIEHLLSLFSSLLRLLPTNSAPRIRTIAKFIEKDYAKITLLINIRRHYAARVTFAELRYRQKNSLDSDHDDALLSARLGAGLFCLQTADVLLAWLVAEDRGARERIEGLLADREEGFEELKTSIREQIEGSDEETEEGREVKAMLRSLMRFLV